MGKKNIDMYFEGKVIRGHLYASYHHHQRLEWVESTLKWRMATAETFFFTFGGIANGQSKTNACAFKKFFLRTNSAGIIFYKTFQERDQIFIVATR